nr:copia protein [Tanacetum cinerariifolium]
MSRHMLTVGSTMTIPLLYRGEYSQWVERHMLGSEYGEQDRKAAYEYETFKATGGELLLDTYIRYLQVINDLKKCGYSKDNCELNFKFLNHLQPEWKQCAIMMRQNKNLIDINIDALYSILNDSDQEINANMVFMAQIEKVLSDLKTSSASADDKISEVSYYLSVSKSESEYETSRYYDNTTTYGLFVNDNDDQEIFHDCENFPKNLIESQINHNESVVDHNDSEGIDKLIRNFNKKIAKCLKHQLQVKHVVIDTHIECQEKYAKLEAENEYMIRYSPYFDNDKQHRNQIADQEVLYDKMSIQLVLLDQHVRDLKNTVLEKVFKISELEECVRNKDLEIEKCLKRLNVCENKLHKMGQTNQTVHMIMPSKDILYNGRKGIGFENPSYFEKAKDLRPSLFAEKVIGLGYTPMYLTHSDEALEIEKFKRARGNKIEFAYDYRSLNASYVNEKINFLDDYFQDIINPDFEKIDSLFQQTSSLKPYVPIVILEKFIIDLEDVVVSLLEKEKENLETIEFLKSKGFESSENVISESEKQSENDCQVVEKECDQVENSKVIAPGMFKLNVSQSVSPTSVSKTSCASENDENKTKRKRRKKKSSKQNDKHVNNDVLHANRDFVYFLDLDTISSVRRPNHSDVIWKQKRSSNTSNVNLFSVSNLKLNKDVKRYSRKDLLSCNNSHLGETRSAYVCNDAMNVSCNSRFCDSFDENNLFIFDDESVRISPVSKMPFRKKPSDSINVRSKSNSNKSLPRIVHGNENSMASNYLNLRFKFKVKDFVQDCYRFNLLKKRLKIAFKNADLSSRVTLIPLKINHSKLNKDVKRYSRKDLLSCNNSHLGEISCAYFCSDAMNVSCNSRLCDSFDENNLFIFDDESVRMSPVSKMPFGKKPRDSLNVFLWIIDSGCLKHMTGNRALLTNFMEKFLGTVRFGNNDFAVIAGYRDVVIGSMTIKKVYYVEGLGHNLFSVGQFYDKGLEVAFRKSTCFVRNEDGVDLLAGDRSSNLYTIALNEVALNSSTCLLAKSSSSQSWLWHQHLSHLNFATINNLGKNNLVQGFPKMKFKKDHLCSACEQGKIHQKHHKSKTDFASNKPLYLLHMDMCGPMHVESINEKQYVLVVVDDYSRSFHKSSESFQEESFSSSLNDDVQLSSKEVGVPSSNTQSVSNNMVPNVDKASTSHNVFNKRLEDAYFDACTSFHDPSNVHTFYQPYPHEKK